MVSGWFSSSTAIEPPLPDEDLVQSRLIDRFLGRLAVVPVRNSRLVDVRFQSPDPALASTVATALASAYIAQNLEFTCLSPK